MRITWLFKNKRGDVLILTMAFVVLFIFMTIFIVDIGMGYLARVQMQNITDASAIAGAKAGAYAYISRTVDQSPRAIVKPDLADAEAMKVFSMNSKYLPDRVTVSSPVINPNGEIIDGKPMNSLEQYYSGNFTVKLSGSYKTFFLNRNIFGLDLNLPFLNFRTEARVHVKPKVIEE